MKLKKWCEDYLVTWKRSTLKDSTFKAYCYYLIYIDDNIDIENLDVIQLQRIINNMHIKGLSLATIKRTFCVIRQAVRKAYYLHMCPKIDFEFLEFPRAEAHKVDCLSAGEIRQIIDYNDSLFCFLLYSGCRISEALALTRSDIDFENGRIIINKNNYRGVVSSTKTTSSSRTIPLTRDLLNVIANISHLNERLFDCDYFSAYKRFKQLFPHHSPHSLRHTYATAALRSGVDVKTLSSLLGHASVQITLDVYCSVPFDLKQKEADKIRFFFPPGSVGNDRERPEACQVFK